MAANVAVRGVSFAYGKNVPVLEDVSLAFYPGEVVALTGPSGRGKSTLLYILGLLLQPSTGEITVHGDRVDNWADAALSTLRAERFGFVFQDAALNPSRTILDNVLETCLYRGEDPRGARGKAEALLEQFGVNHRSGHKPGEVSGGQAQRIALCRALLNNPSIILADEPTGNLDSESSAVVLGAFRHRAAEGATVLIATHDPAVVAQADRSVVL